MKRLLVYAALTLATYSCFPTKVSISYNSPHTKEWYEEEVPQFERKYSDWKWVWNFEVYQRKDSAQPIDSQDQTLTQSLDTLLFEYDINVKGFNNEYSPLNSDK